MNRLTTYKLILKAVMSTNNNNSLLLVDSKTKLQPLYQPTNNLRSTVKINASLMTYPK